MIYYLYSASRPKEPIKRIKRHFLNIKNNETTALKIKKNFFWEI